MEETLFTVDQAADYLKLHPKTILRLIREERLRGKRIGKSYRIHRADLDIFAGVPEQRAAPSGAVRVTSIVEIGGLATAEASRIATALQATLLSRGGGAPAMQMTTAYDTQARTLKLVVIGPPADTAALLDVVPRLAGDGT
jgi:excisionase family DNA binding protein